MSPLIVVLMIVVREDRLGLVGLCFLKGIIVGEGLIHYFFSCILGNPLEGIVFLSLEHFDSLRCVASQ